MSNVAEDTSNNVSGLTQTGKTKFLGEYYGELSEEARRRSARGEEAVTARAEEEEAKSLWGWLGAAVGFAIGCAVGGPGACVQGGKWGAMAGSFVGRQGTDLLMSSEDIKLAEDTGMFGGSEELSMIKETNLQLEDIDNATGLLSDVVHTGKLGMTLFAGDIMAGAGFGAGATKQNWLSQIFHGPQPGPYG